MKFSFLLFLLFFYPFLGFSQNADTVSIATPEKVIKRSFSDDLNQKYSEKVFDYNRDYQLMQEPNWWQKLKRWFAEKIQKLFNFKNAGQAIKIVEWIVKIVGFLLIIFVIYKIVRAFINEKGIWIFGRTSDAIEIVSRDLEQNLFQTDFNQLIAEAIAKKQYRLAVRYYYLATLKKMATAELIQWHPEKTNLDYYRELKNSEHKVNFRHLSYLYEYCWYGEFDLNENQFQTGEQSFKNFIKTI